MRPLWLLYQNGCVLVRLWNMDPVGDVGSPGLAVATATRLLRRRFLVSAYAQVTVGILDRLNLLADYKMAEREEDTAQVKASALRLACFHRLHRLR